jgi:hypothetical protein
MEESQSGHNETNKTFWVDVVLGDVMVQDVAGHGSGVPYAGVDNVQEPVNILLLEACW